MFECGRMIPDKIKSWLPPGVRRGDLLLLVFFLGSSLLLAVLLALNSRRGDTLQIYADGQLFYELPLMQDVVQEKGTETYLLIRFLDDGAPVFTLDAQEPELPEGTSFFPHPGRASSSAAARRAANRRFTGIGWPPDLFCVYLYHSGIAGPRQ